MLLVDCSLPASWSLLSFQQEDTCQVPPEQMQLTSLAENKLRWVKKKKKNYPMLLMVLETGAFRKICLQGLK